MVLIGKNYAGYGDFLDENFIHLLENGSNATQPSAPLVGQLWWDTANSLLKVYNGTIFKTISAATSSASAPTSNVTGDLWYDTVNQQLKVWTGSAFIVVGPAFSATQGTAGAIPETITDSVGATKLITSLYVNNNRVGIVYDQASFVPQAGLVSTFPTVFPGITLTSTNTPIFAGTANNAGNLQGFNASQFMRSDTATSTTGSLSIINDAGLSVGTGPALKVTEVGNDALVRSDISGGNLILSANVGGIIYTVASALGATGTFAIANAATVGTNLTATGNVTGGNLLSGGIASVTGNITGGNIEAVALVKGASVSAAANIIGGNLLTTGLVSVTGNISSAANIAGNFFIGNGSQLTGILTTANAASIQNGTSNVAIPTQDGNATISITGVANVAVFTDTGPVFGVGNVTVAAIDKTGSNAVGNIGSSSNYFNRVFATATTALYADVAERFAADTYLEPGTVVELGGSAEITRAELELTESVFGVISTNAAYLMNGGAGDDDTHPAVAMTGRVPVRVTGQIRKGDRLVSAGKGLARAARPGEATAFNVIGRALQDKLKIDDGVVEAIVSTK